MTKWPLFLSVVAQFWVGVVLVVEGDTFLALVAGGFIGATLCEAYWKSRLDEGREIMEGMLEDYRLCIETNKQLAEKLDERN